MTGSVRSLSALLLGVIFLFFFNDTATTEIYTLSLHDALPICRERGEDGGCARDRGARAEGIRPLWPPGARRAARSEEHTSELQSRLHLVCRLLLEKKKKGTLQDPHFTTVTPPDTYLSVDHTRD